MPDIREGEVDDADRRTIIANGVVIDVIANDDGSTYVEFYTYETGRRVEVSAAFIDAYRYPHPSLRLVAR